eukprot:TRINITY_DN5964_c0_g1_i2.p1 TRINITY_DN5964_c0_g1~~TRINITY_DN5964_c0_g1_i2.p1  ORF type:complete len:362 (-),score=28.31 TRINITY_DN5964_c0_g1_i2:747-1754(-)
MSWQCKSGHSWQHSTKSFQSRRTWSSHCASLAPVGLKRCQAHAESLSGQCLATQYVNSRSKMPWQCKFGRTWQATADSVLIKGTWCPRCAGKTVGLKRCQAHAESLGGQCLATQYVNSRSKMPWQCKFGHTWQATANSVLNKGTWCPHCAGKAPVGLERCQARAESSGGQCLATLYVNSGSKMPWQCKFGHTWQATANSVLNKGTWCPICASRSLKNENEVRRILQDIFYPYQFPQAWPSFLSRLQLDCYYPELKLAAEYHGEQHYHKDHYFHSNDPLAFKKLLERDKRKVELCKTNGVRLIVIPYSVGDEHNCIRFQLAQWFPISAVNPVFLNT